MSSMKYGRTTRRFARRSRRAEAEQHRIEVADESTRAKNRFLARMSHEIRTPITAVIGISEIELQNPEISAQMEENFAKIHTSANSLLSIVNDILDLSKIETGKMELLHEEYDVSSLISDVTGLHPYFSGGKDLEFQLSVDENMPSHLFGDASRICQVLNNLLSNAFKYTDAGKVELTWEWDGTNIIATVRDTGFGISAEQIKILKKGDYTRLHKDEGQATGGAGIGLAIVFSLLDLMHAKIDIKSEVGMGTTIGVHIPQRFTRAHFVLGPEIAKRLQDFQVSSISKRFPFIPDPMPYGSVLLVDDVEANLFVTRKLLAFYDLKVESCISGYDAIDIIQQGKKFDLIFMDYMMPGMNGIETMEMLREMGYHEPIVALTANALIGNAERFISAGFDGFIPKPINPKQLNDALRKFIRNKQPPQVLRAAEAARKHAPVSISTLHADGEILEKLRSDFLRQKKNAIIEITEALNAGDTNQVHFLAHTIKGCAALIHENALAKAAEIVEGYKDEMPPQEAFATLESEFKSVIERVRNTMSTESISKPDKTAALELLNELEPMLTLRKAQCITALGELRGLPEAAVFVRQVDNFDFVAALATLPVLRDILDE